MVLLGAVMPESNAALNVIPRMSLKHVAIQRVCDAIERGELKPGDDLRELGLAKRLGVAQATIREALVDLEYNGFIERNGTRKKVTLLTRPDIDDIYLVRARLEVLAVELVAAQASPDLQTCRERVEEMDAAAREETPGNFWHADLAFHRALWRCSQSKSLEMSLERLVPKLFAFGIMRHTRPTVEERLKIAESHRKLLDLLYAGDTDGARSMMDASMERARLDDEASLD